MASLIMVYIQKVAISKENYKGAFIKFKRCNKVIKEILGITLKPSNFLQMHFIYMICVPFCQELKLKEQI